MANLLPPSLIDKLVTRAMNDQHVNVVGGPGSGKTHLVALLERVFREKKQHTAVIDLNQFEHDGTPVRFWRTILAAITGKTASGVGADVLRSCIERALLNQERRLWLAIDGLDRLLAYERFCNLKFLGILRSFATSPQVSLTTTSQCTLHSIHRAVEAVVGKIQGSPLNFMSDLLISVPGFAEVEAYVHSTAPDLGNPDIVFIHETMLGHPQLTAWLTEALAAAGPDVSAKTEATAQVLEAHDNLLRLIFRSWPPDQAFALVCEVLSSLGGRNAPRPDVSDPKSPAVESGQDMYIAEAHTAIVDCHPSALEVAAGLQRFDAGAVTELPNAGQVGLHRYVGELIDYLRHRGRLDEYLLHLASDPQRRASLAPALALRPGAQASSPPSFARADHERFVVGDRAHHFARQGVVVSVERGNEQYVGAVAHVWRWWVVRELGMRMVINQPNWLQDHGLTEFARGEPLRRFQRLMADAVSVSRTGTRPMIRAVVERTVR